MIEFRQKEFGLSSNVLTGSSIGAGIGTLAANLGGFRFRRGAPKVDKAQYGTEALKTVLIGAALGAFAGVLYTAADEVSKKINKRSTINNRLMDTVVHALKSAGLKEGTDFTRSPKEASRLKTKVCISISKVDGDLRVLINQVSDPKLKEITKDMISTIPNTSAITEKQSDRFNDIIITTISDSSADAGLVTGIAERFIHSGYPVYLVEVG